MDDDFFTDKQYEELSKVTREIIKNYPLINQDSIVGHSDVSPQRKTDPGDRFDWKRYLGGL